MGLRALRVKLAKKWSYAAALLLSCGTGLLRWSGMAQAVTTVKPGAFAVKPPAKRHIAPPRHLMGKVAAPRLKPLNPAVGPDPFAVPGQPQRPMMGAVTAPPPPPAEMGQLATGLVGPLPPR